MVPGTTDGLSVTESNALLRILSSPSNIGGDVTSLLGALARRSHWFCQATALAQEVLPHIISENVGRELQALVRYQLSRCEECEVRFCGASSAIVQKLQILGAATTSRRFQAGFALLHMQAIWDGACPVPGRALLSSSYRPETILSDYSATGPPQLRGEPAGVQENEAAQHILLLSKQIRATSTISTATTSSRQQPQKLGESFDTPRHDFDNEGDYADWFYRGVSLEAYATLGDDIRRWERQQPSTRRKCVFIPFWCNNAIESVTHISRFHEFGERCSFTRTSGLTSWEETGISPGDFVHVQPAEDNHVTFDEGSLALVLPPATPGMLRPEDYPGGLETLEMMLDAEFNGKSVRKVDLFFFKDDFAAMLGTEDFSGSSKAVQVLLEMSLVSCVTTHTRRLETLFRLPSVMPSFPAELRQILLRPSWWGRGLYYQNFLHLERLAFERKRRSCRDGHGEIRYDPRVDIVEKVLQCGTFNTSQTAAIRRVGNVHYRCHFGRPLVGKATEPVHFDPHTGLLETSRIHGDAITLIQGPPGTGKTGVVRALLSILAHEHPSPQATVQEEDNQKARILVCTASNAALDELLERVLNEGLVCINEEKPPGCVRIGRTNLESVECFCVDFLAKKNGVARQDVLEKAQLVFSTLSSSGHPMMHNQRFTYLLVDESAQASEVDILTPLMRPICKHHPVKRIILVGDPMQLPPTVISSEAHAFLEMSLLERLMGTLFSHGLKVEENQTREGYVCVLNDSIGTVLQLNTQYRMHPIISRFPSAVIYGGNIQDGVSAADREANFHSDKFFRPVVFINTDSKTRCQSHRKPGSHRRPDHQDHPDEGIELMEEQESIAAMGQHSKSIYNRGEAEIVISLLCYLFQNPGTAFENIQGDQVVVLTPYRAQVEVIKREREHVLRAMRTKNLQTDGASVPTLGTSLKDIEPVTWTRPEWTEMLSKVLVTTVDAMQGQERDISIISTVRSNKRNEIGFLAQKRRLNVALTRAKRSLVVVGSQKTLRDSRTPGLRAEHSVWRGFVKHCVENGFVVSAADVARWDHPRP